MTKAKGHHPHGRGRRHRNPQPSTMPNFIRLAPTVMQDLIDKFDLTPLQAAAAVGNLGTESADFTSNHEKGQRENRGGYGWGQWTKSRRVAFFAWADARKLARDSEAASLGFLEHEMETTHRYAITSLKRQTELSAATSVFMKLFEAPRIPHESDRLMHAKIALQEYNRLHSAQLEASH